MAAAEFLRIQLLLLCGALHIFRSWDALLDAVVFGDVDGFFFWLDVGVAEVGLDLGHFCAEQQDEARVVRPEVDDHERSGCAVVGTDRAVGEVEAEEGFADHEQTRGDAGAEPYVLPGDGGIGQDFVH